MIHSRDARRGVFQRFTGMIVSPAATLADIAENPRPLSLIAAVSMCMAICTALFLSTEIGRMAWLDEAVRQIESFGRALTDAQYARLDRLKEYAAYIAVAQALVGVPLVTFIAALVAHVWFRRTGEPRARFRQTLGIVAGSGVILAVRQLCVLPVDYVRESMTNTTNIGLLLPFLPEGSLAARFFGTIDLFVAWCLAVLALGLAILYHRPAPRIAMTLFSLYGLLALALAVVLTLMGGS